MTHSQGVQIAIEVLTVLAAVFYNTRQHTKTIRNEAARVIEERKRVDAERKAFESEKVSFLAEQSKFLVEKLKTHSERLDQTDRKEDQLREELHAVGGKVEAVGSMYSDILAKAKERREAKMTIEPGKPDLIDQSKVSTKKEKA